MTIRVWNTLTDKKEDLAPLVAGHVGIYVCGITVYDLPHIGHARMLIAFDTWVRFLRFAGLNVKYVRNWTDVDDKIIKRAAERGIDPGELAQGYIDECRKDMASLNIMPADIEPRATEHIAEMHAIIKTLIEKKHAYALNGDVYYSVRSLPAYGKLSKRTVEDLDELLSGARVEVDETKKDPLDFALWKASKPGEPKSVTWQSPWGPGRPGWHIECSAMCQKHLGVTFDLHGGGKDLVFPHHENEIAQSEGASGKPLAVAWLHNGFVTTANNEKMSKSLGNFKTIRDLLAQWDGEAVRALLLSTHYRHPIQFGFDALAEADRRIEMFYETDVKVAAFCSKKLPDGKGKILQPQRDAFQAALEDDCNTPDALAHLLAIYNQLNARIDGKAPPQEALDLAATAQMMREVLGLGWRPAEQALQARRTIAALRKGIDPAWVETQIAARIAARKEKRFADADAIRIELQGKGVELRDSAAGTDWRVPA